MNDVIMCKDIDRDLYDMLWVEIFKDTIGGKLCLLRGTGQDPFREIVLALKIKG